MRTFQSIIEEPRYVDGIISLHSQLNIAINEIIDFAISYLPNNQHEIKDLRDNEKCGIIVDFTIPQPENRLSGYMVIKNFILRFYQISVDYATLFPIRAYNSLYDKGKSNGVKFHEINELKKTKKPFLLTISRKLDSWVNDPLYIFDIDRTFNIENHNLIDLGNPYRVPQDITKLNLEIKIPESIKNKEYSLVDIQNNAPLYRCDECYCMLIALNDEIKSVKILRWFPRNRESVLLSTKEYLKTYNILREISFDVRRYKRALKRTCQNNSSREQDYYQYELEKKQDYERELQSQIKYMSLPKDCLFDLGFVKNNELYQFMINSDSRILIGRVKKNKVSILGNINLVKEREWSFPRYLTNIKLM